MYQICSMETWHAKSGRRHFGRCCPWFVTPPSNGGFSGTTEAIVRVWLPHPPGRYRSISILKRHAYILTFICFFLLSWHMRHILFSFNLDCPGAKGLTILSLLPDCAALIQLEDLSFKVQRVMGMGCSLVPPKSQFNQSERTSPQRQYLIVPSCYTNGSNGCP